MKLFKVFIIFIFSFSVNSAPKECADYVDQLRLFYINGMFTPYAGYLDNKRELAIKIGQPYLY